MTTATKRETYRQCVLHASVPGGCREHVAWLPSRLARVGRYVVIDDPVYAGTRWLIISAGEARSAEVAEAYAEHGRVGLPDGEGPSTPMRRSAPPKKTKKPSRRKKT